MFHNFLILNYIFYNIIKFQKDITEKVRLVVLHGLATIDALTCWHRVPANNLAWTSCQLASSGELEIADSTCWLAAGLPPAAGSDQQSGGSVLGLYLSPLNITSLPVPTETYSFTLPRVHTGSQLISLPVTCLPHPQGAGWLTPLLHPPLRLGEFVSTLTIKLL
jgi:hypothetical protein